MCGIIGICGSKDISLQLLYALRAVQHRGQSASGFITYDGHIHAKKEAGMVSELVRSYNNEEDLLEHYPGSIGIGHTRYSTFGLDDPISLKRNAQPEYLVNPFVACCHNGNLYNTSEVYPHCWRKPRTDCDIQALLLPMAQALPAFTGIGIDSIVHAGEHVMSLVKGSYAALYLTVGKHNSYLVGMTDPYKIRPMVTGYDDDKEQWIITSESVVLKRLGIEVFKDVDGGSVIGFESDNPEPHVKKVVDKKKHICMFEFIYFANPASVMEGMSVHKARVELGRMLARKHPCETADIVVPVPESGRRYAIGFCHESGIPIEEGLVKAKRDRSFIMQTQEKRDEVVEHNLYAINEVLEDKEVVLTDDSLIRGTNMRKVVRKLKRAGAKKVHVRIGCPPVVAPCYLGIDMRSKKEFIAVDEDGNLRDWDLIAEEIGADSLAYSSMSALRKAILNGRDDIDICCGCLNFPDGYPPELREDVADLYQKDKKGMRAYEN